MRINAISLSVILLIFLLNIGVVSADTLGQVANFNIASEYDVQARQNMPVTLRYVSQHAYWYIADEYWNSISNGGRQEILDKTIQLANEFDTRVYPTETAFFGSEPNPGIDNDSRLTIALIPMQNSAGGYIDTANEVPKRILPRSNEREMVFLNISLITDLARVKSYLAHEFQHLISVYERDILRNSPDDVWLNELRSEYAVDLLGYNDQSTGTNIQRRALTFLQNTKDSLTEWKNELIDYSSIALFANYVGNKFGKNVIGQTTRVTEVGISALRTTLKQAGFDTTFENVFVAWWTASLLNDPASKWFGYGIESLKGFTVKPEKIIALNNNYTSELTQLTLKDWQGGWYQINRPEDFRVLTKISFDSKSLESFAVGVILYNNDGTYTVSVKNISAIDRDLIFDWSNVKLERVYVMPFKRDRLSGFTGDESAVSLNFVVSNFSNITNSIRATILQPISFVGTISNIISDIANARPSDFGLTEGDFIKADNSPDIFIINDYGYKRLVLNPQICLMYGHLGARGCFSATKNVALTTRDAFKTSNYYTNGETKDGIIYELVQTGDDSAYLKKINEIIDSKKVFNINTNEFKSYSLQ